MNKSQVFREREVIKVNGYIYGIVKGRSDTPICSSAQKIPKANFMGMEDWALQWCRKIDKNK